MALQRSSHMTYPRARASFCVEPGFTVSCAPALVVGVGVAVEVAVAVGCVGFALSITVVTKKANTLMPENCLVFVSTMSRVVRSVRRLLCDHDHTGCQNSVTIAPVRKQSKNIHKEFRHSGVKFRRTRLCIMLRVLLQTSRKSSDIDVVP